MWLKPGVMAAENAALPSQVLIIYNRKSKLYLIQVTVAVSECFFFFFVYARLLVCGFTFFCSKTPQKWPLFHQHSVNLQVTYLHALCLLNIWEKVQKALLFLHYEHCKVSFFYYPWQWILCSDTSVSVLSWGGGGVCVCCSAQACC